ncbi:MAG: MBL fold metallo-hydrolase [Candidatus Omnitrophica bacterium]|nr:MBL fold metallo-hydrolase [Candidatus Omnitrophota bacterium]
MINLLGKLTGKANPFAPRPYGELQKVTDRVYIFRNITNSSFVIGDKGIAVIDTQVNHPLARILIQHIRSVTDKPILYAINTHYHWDHTNGNQLFRDLGATVVSSKLTREFMTTRYERQKEFLLGRGFEIAHDPMFPNETFDGVSGGERTLDLGGVSLRLFYAGKAESDDATAVWVEQEKTLMAGDTIMTGSFPIFGQPVWDEGLEGTGQWENTMAKLLTLKPAHIIPGHGPLAGQKETDLLLKIARFFVEEVRARVDKGMTLEQILKDMEPKLPKWITEIPVVWGNPRYAILRVYRSITLEKGSEQRPGWQQFKPSAIPAPKQSLKEIDDMAHEAKEGGDPALRLAVLARAAELSPNDADAHAKLADALIEVSRSEDSVLEKGDYFSRAKASWRRALEINPTHAPSLLGRGRYLTMMAYRGGEDPEMGMIYLDTAREHAKDPALLAEIDFYTGMGHRRMGDETRAKEFFRKSLSANAGFMPATLALGS